MSAEITQPVFLISTVRTDQNGDVLGPGVCGNGYLIGTNNNGGQEPVCCKCRWTVVQKTPNVAEAIAALRATIKAGVAPTACLPGSLGRTCYGEET